MALIARAGSRALMASTIFGVLRDDAVALGSLRHVEEAHPVHLGLHVLDHFPRGGAARRFRRASR